MPPVIIWARRTVRGWQLCGDAQSPVGLRCRESASADQNAGGERGNWGCGTARGTEVMRYSESAFGTADNVRWPDVTVMSTLLSYAAPTAIIFCTFPEFI